MNKTFAAFAILGMASAINLNQDSAAIELEPEAVELEPESVELEPEQPEDNGLAQVGHLNHFSDGKCRSASGPAITMTIQNDTDEWV